MLSPANLVPKLCLGACLPETLLPEFGVSQPGNGVPGVRSQTEFGNEDGCIIRVMHNGFLAELARLGPEAPPRPWTLATARGYCARLTRSHYENFSVASLLLPRRLLPHFHAVYAYCRWADDLADEAGGGERALALLRWWREELLRCYDGEPRHPVMLALQPTIRRFAIPPRPFLDLLLAFEQDQIVKQYQTYEQLLDYCR